MKFEININGDGLEELTRIEKEVIMDSVLGCIQDEVSCEMGMSGYIELPRTSYQGSKPIVLEISYELKAK